MKKFLKIILPEEKACEMKRRLAFGTTCLFDSHTRQVFEVNSNFSLSILFAL